MDFVTVFTAFQSPDADLVCARLEAAGFHPQVANEIASATLPGYSRANLIRVEVPAAEAAEAKEFLEAGETPEK